MTTRDEVLVVGAGPTGLHLAGQLARHGVPVRIVDRRPGGAAESRALAIHARTLELLDHCGLAEEFVAHGQPVSGFSLWDGTSRLARIDFGMLDSPFPFLLDIPQDETERILCENLAALGVGVERCTEVTSVVPGGDAVEVTTRGPGGGCDRARYAYAVGCDGAHSTVRRCLGMPFDGQGYPEDWLLADVALAWDRPRDDLHVVFNPAGRATVFMPLPGERWRIILYFAGDRRGADTPTVGDIAELVARRVPGPITISDPTWVATFRTHRRSAPGYRRGRVLLAGDAVHIHSPAGGQGLNVGLQDAHNLAWKLAAVLTSGASDRLLDSYEAERTPIARQVLALSHNLVRLSALSTPWKRALRGLVLPRVVRLPSVRSRAAHRISHLHVDYRRSPLTERTPSARGRGIRPGGRVPDIAGLRLDGRPVALRHLLREQRYQALVVPGNTGPDARTTEAVTGLRTWAPLVRLLVVVPPGGQADGGEVVAVTDRDGSVRRAFGPGVHLIRPDGYLAASGLRAVESHLQGVFGTTGRPGRAARLAPRRA